MKNSIPASGALFTLLGVMAGAFGAHRLKELVTPEKVESFMTGTEYQIYHGIAIILCWVIARSRPGKLIKATAVFFMVGILLFSGSIYLLATAELTGIPTNILGPVTPLGGLCFMGGWILMIISFLTKEKA